MKSYVLFRSDSPEDWARVSATSAKEAAEKGKEVFPDAKHGTQITAHEGKDGFSLAPIADAERHTITII